MLTLHSTYPLFLLLALDLRAQGSIDGTRPTKFFIGSAPPVFSTTTDSLAFTEFNERNMSNGASYAVPFRSRGYRMVWHMHQEADSCTVWRGDRRTLKEFQAEPPPGYTAQMKPTAYGTRCVVVQMAQPQKKFQLDSWYFEAP